MVAGSLGILWGACHPGASDRKHQLRDTQAASEGRFSESEPASTRDGGGRGGVCPELTLPAIWGDEEHAALEGVGVSALAKARELEIMLFVTVTKKLTPKRERVSVLRLL